MWTDIFRSRYVRLLENAAQLHVEEIAKLRKQHAEETERIKTVHAQELERAINEANRGWAEADRLRQYLIPGLPASSRVAEPTDNTPPLEETERGTPFQRLMAKRLKDMAEMDRLKKEEAKKNQFPTPKESPASPAQEKN